MNAAIVEELLNLLHEVSRRLDPGPRLRTHRVGEPLLDVRRPILEDDRKPL
jgi:hypothetical protein